MTVNLNELMSRHHDALTDMAEAPSQSGREWAEACADYYASRIVTLRGRLGADNPANDSGALDSFLRG